MIRKYGRSSYVMRFELLFYMREEPDKFWTFVFRDRLLPTDMESGREEDFLARINKQWTAWVEELSEDANSYLVDIVGRLWTIRSDIFPRRRYFRSPFPDESEEFTTSHAVYMRFQEHTEISSLFGFYYFTLDNFKSEHYSNGAGLVIHNYTFKNYNDAYLLAASFVGQTNYQYLGFTNTEFIRPKLYIIPNGDRKFWIDAVTADGRGEIELDYRDLIAIELQLTTIPLQKYA